MFGSSPYGSSPYGALLTVGGATTSSITSLIEGNLHTLLEHIIWFRPISSSTGAPIDLYVSGGWYRSKLSDTFPTGEPLPHQLFIGHLFQPPNIETRILSNGEINEGSSTYGQCVIIDQRRELIQWLSYNWSNAQLRYFIGDKSWQLNSFAEITKGVTTSIESQGAQMNITIQDVVSKLQTRDYQSNLYAGRGACVRLNGSTSYLSGTIPCPAGSMTMGIRIRPRANIAADEHIVGWRNGAVAGVRKMRTDPTNSVVWGVRNDAGVSYSITAANILSPYKWTDLWAVLDTSAMRISIYDGAAPNTPLVQAPVAGTFSTVLSLFAIGRLPDVASNFLAADVDELTVWAHALTSVEIAKWTGQRAPSDTTDLIYQYSMTEAVGITTFESSGAGPNLTLNSSTWVDSLTGGIDLQGKCIPKGRGIVRKLAPVVVSPIDLIYQVSETFDHIATDISGSILEDGGIRVWTLLGTYTDPWAATPATGEYMEIPSMGLIRLGSAPIRQLTCDVYLTASVDLPSCVTGILTGDGVLDSTEVDAGSIAALPSTLGVGYISGLDPIKVDTVLVQFYLRSVKAWRAPNQQGALSFGIISPPESLTPSAYTTGDDYTLDGIAPVSTLPAARAALIRYRAYYQTQPPANSNPTLTEAAKQDLNQQYRSVSTPVNLDVLADDPSADLAARDTVLDSIIDAQLQALLEAEWRSKPRRTDRLTLAEPVPRFHVGQIINITMPILDYDNGKNVIVGDTVYDPANNSHTIEVTGELAEVGGDAMLVGDNSGTALMGDGAGEGLVNI